MMSRGGDDTVPVRLSFAAGMRVGQMNSAPSLP
jgi:hypothetical protein